MFGLLFGLLSCAALFLYPLYASSKALSANDPRRVKAWLIYWLVVTVFEFVESAFGFLFVWLPLYQFFRFMFILSLAMPGSEGASHLYYAYIEPTLVRYESNIESCAAAIKDRATAHSTEAIDVFVRRFTRMIGELVFGVDPAMAGAETRQEQQTFGVRKVAVSGIQPQERIDIRALFAQHNENDNEDQEALSRSTMYTRLWGVGSAVLKAAYVTTFDVAAASIGAGNAQAPAPGDMLDGITSIFGGASTAMTAASNVTTNVAATATAAAATAAAATGLAGAATMVTKRGTVAESEVVAAAKAEERKVCDAAEVVREAAKEEQTKVVARSVTYLGWFKRGHAKPIAAEQEGAHDDDVVEDAENEDEKNEDEEAIADSPSGMTPTRHLLPGTFVDAAAVPTSASTSLTTVPAPSRSSLSVSRASSDSVSSEASWELI
ncbi:TB2/DP1, HVA22 family-domain-containing protein [Limtongia smithiae]|uniref:TB2/DP1, HVA22 family-domain-containing protein n=1 Tax=Limtongia smithiae TaxID=1125753 RepID=UPI0034CD54A8